ncbi:hypothetical protein A2U01_0054745, partial [Trifolium medium]|nr:hypothetical protein [Trifolium medium]
WQNTLLPGEIMHRQAIWTKIHCRIATRVLFKPPFSTSVAICRQAIPGESCLWLALFVARKPIFYWTCVASCRQARVGEN